MKKTNRFRPSYNLKSFAQMTKSPCTIIACDCETEGMDCLEDRIIQFSALRYEFDGNKLTETASFDTYIKNVHPLSEIIINKIGITEEMLAPAPTEKDVFPAIKQFMDGADVFMAYNEPFDYGFVSAMYERNNSVFCPRIRFDIMAMSCDLISMYKCARKDLGSVAGYLNVRAGDEQLHNSLADIKLSVKVFEALLDEYKKLSVPTDSSFLPIPKIYKVWTWQNEKNWLMDRIYFATSCGKIFYERKDRSFGCDLKEKAYTVDELNMDAFVNEVLRYFNVERLEDLTHLKT